MLARAGDAGWRSSASSARITEDGLFEPAAVHVVRLMAAFEESGVSLDDIGRGVADDELSFPLGLFMPEPAAMSKTYELLGASSAVSPTCSGG